MNDNIIPLPPRAVPKPKPDGPVPVPALVKVAEAILKRAKNGTLRGISFTSIELVPDPASPEDLLRSIAWSYEYDEDDEMALSQLLVTGLEACKHRLLTEVILGDAKMEEYGAD